MYLIQFYYCWTPYLQIPTIEHQTHNTGTHSSILTIELFNNISMVKSIFVCGTQKLLCILNATYS